MYFIENVNIENTTQTLTNKTLTSPVISTIVNTGTLTLPTSTTTLVGTNTTDTLTNKTLTNPKINSYNFNYIPWTVITEGKNITIAENRANAFFDIMTASTLPYPSTKGQFLYMYSVIGNTLYIQYLYRSYALASAAGSAGSGTYFFKIPSTVTINSKLLEFESSIALGSCVGSGHMYGLNHRNSALHVSCQYNNLVLVESSGLVLHSSSYYYYSLENLSINFEAMVPLA